MVENLERLSGRTSRSGKKAIEDQQLDLDTTTSRNKSQSRSPHKEIGEPTSRTNRTRNTSVSSNASSQTPYSLRSKR